MPLVRRPDGGIHSRVGNLKGTPTLAKIRFVGEAAALFLRATPTKGSINCESDCTNDNQPGDGQVLNIIDILKLLIILRNILQSQPKQYKSKQPNRKFDYP